MLTLVLIRDDRMLDAYTYTIGLAGLILLLLPIVPGVGREINGARLWVAIGPLSFQPAEFGKVLIVIFLASYLADKRELLATGSGRFSAAAREGPGPAADRVGGVARRAVPGEGPGRLAPVLRGVRRDALGRERAARRTWWSGSLLFAIGACVGYLAFSHVQLRVDYWLHALDPAKVYELGYGQLAQGWFGMAIGRPRRHRARAWARRR